MGRKAREADEAWRISLRKDGSFEDSKMFCAWQEVINYQKRLRTTGNVKVRLSYREVCPWAFMFQRIQHRNVQ